MFMTFFFGAWTLFHFYVFWRVASVPLVVRYVRRRYLFAAGVLLWASFFLRRFLESQGSDALARPLELFVMNWLGSLFLLFVCFLIVDIVTAFGFLFRRRVPLLRTIGLLAGVLIVGTAFIQGMRPPVVNDYEVRLPNLPPADDGLVIAVISDLHVGSLLDGQWLGARVEQVKAIKPDMVIMLGDLFEGDSQTERQESMITMLRGLTPKLGVWAVMGNHESHGGRDSSVRFLEDAGFHVLRNEWSEVLPGLALGGVNDDDHHDTVASSDDMVKRFLAAKPRGEATIFLSHRPRMAEEAARAGVGLMLCGHTHGGQIWPFSYISGYVNTYLSGWYDINGMPLIVNRGAGTWGPRMRLWLPGEILRITLRTKPS